VRFWDTSAVVALFVAEPRTAQAETIFREDPEPVLWWGSSVEYESALQRSRRESGLDHEGVAIARESFRLLHESAVEVQPTEELRAGAMRLLAEHALGAADALQLASALVWSGRPADGAGFVCFDGRLGEAARREGFTVSGSE
jgi:predicted nucleic acid-binding protein